MSTPTNEPRIYLRNRLQADFYSTSSAVASVLPTILDFTVNHKSPNKARLRWWHVRRPDDYTPPAQWLTYNQDDSAASILPKNFKISAIIKINREIMDEKLRLHGKNARPALAYKLGSATMAGYSSRRHEILGLEYEDDAYYTATMGIGKGVLIAGAGVLFRDGIHKTYDPLREGLEAGPVMLKEELPIFIPRPGI